jgi:hypothetical protein
MVTDEDWKLASDMLYLLGAREVVVRRLGGLRQWVAFWLLSYVYQQLLKHM